MTAALTNLWHLPLAVKSFEPIYRQFPGIGIDAPRLASVMIAVAINGHDNVIFENRDLRAYGLGE